MWPEAEELAGAWDACHALPFPKKPANAAGWRPLQPRFDANYGWVHAMTHSMCNGET